ncbi:hypothetical protein CAEBREN_03548 [Caenorhabditis brenneri]|uniref:CUE domain-containing protein n=1 Tax=Caenorhabditis brenneri TaxID=135651 RepID=G0NGP2_CAEBE|nr:hypothetical protein CAEBREN_03548 [Caenorhabditis brenneri]
MRLVEISALSDDSALALWEASCDTVSHQIDLKLARKEGGLMEIFNAVVASLPRKSDAFRLSAISSKDSLVKAHQKLLENLTKTIPILIESGWKKSPDYQKSSLIDSFSLLEEKDAVRIFKMAQETRTITEDDVDDYFALFDKKFDRLLNYGKPQFETSAPEDRSKYANLCVEVLVAIGASVKNAQKISNFLESQEMKASKIWMTRIPEVFEKVTNAFDYPTLFDVAMALNGFPLRKVFMARRFALQSMLEVFVEMAPSTKYKVRERCRQELEKSSRFVGYAAELGHEAVLTEFSPKVISQSIEDSRRRLEVETIERLRKCGYLENLGDPQDELVKSQIASIREILPDFSKEIVHLALRHFSYDSEATLGNLLSRENLPLELLRLEHTELRSGAGSGEWPPLDFTASDEIEREARAEKKARDEEMRRNNEKKSATNLFSLALIDREPSPPVDEQAELRARAEAYRTSVLTKLQKIRSAASTSTDPTEKIAVDAENLVPMATSKKYSALNSLKISEADKVALRPTYDKYRYETPDDDEGNRVYDDEYDDEFDGREFKMERLNQELETSSDEETEDPNAPPGLSLPSRSAPQGGQRGGQRGGRGNRGGRGGGGRGASSSTTSASKPDGYTGGRDRQMKERHKSDNKQRGADRRKRGMAT